MGVDPFASASAQRAVTVLVVEDDAVVLSWIRAALEGTAFRTAGTANSAKAAVDLLGRRTADVLLIDYRLPDRVGTELLRDLRRAGVRTPALLMTASPERGFGELAREAGAQGTVLKSGSREELLAALDAVARGEETFDIRYPPRPRGAAALSPREREVLRLVATGATNSQISRELGVSPETVKTLLGRIFGKLGVRRRAEAVAVALREGLI